MEDLRQVFLDFTSFGAGQAGSSEMDSAKFVKLAKDCKLVSKKLSTTDLDLIFTKVKDKSEKKINFETFVTAVELIAEKMEQNTEDVVKTIVSAKGPKIGDATVADNVKLHDDKSTFTGVHTHGGPSTLDKHNVDMSRQLDRSEGADIRGVMTYDNEQQQQQPRRTSQEDASRRGSDPKKASPRKSSSKSPSRRKSSNTTSAPRGSVGAVDAAGVAGGGGGGGSGEGDVEGRVLDVFVAFASSVAKASGDMDSMKFFKLMGDSGLAGKALSCTDCDLIFTKTCSTTGCVKKINYDAFRKIAIPLVAGHLQTEEAAVMSKVAAVQGVSSTGTVAQPSRFHDKSTYTGSHAAGGPTHVDQRVSLENLADRSSADVRGVQPSVYKVGPTPAASNTPGMKGSPTRSSRGSAGATNAHGERRKSSLAEAGGTIAGSANKKGGVYDRLCDQSSYTGVYAERFKGGGGRINGDTVNDRASFSGNTNSGGDHAIRDLSQICNRG